jgi:enamine deaminase RidA (YjgF/YER057c/UK114 family)
MKRAVINLAKDKSRGIEALRGSGVPAVFSDALRIDLAECTLLYISGMVATDDSGQVTHRTMREQTRVVLDKIKTVLEREDASFDDIVRVRVYVTQLDPQSLRDIHDVRSTYFRPGAYPASTLVRVSQLIREGALIEIDADAVIARTPRDSGSA